MYDYNRTLERGFSIETFHFLFQSICTHLVNSGKGEKELYKLTDYKWVSHIDASNKAEVSLNTFRVLINKTFEDFNQGIIRPVWDYEIDNVDIDITKDPRLNVITVTLPLIMSFLVTETIKINNLDCNSNLIIDTKNISNDFYITICNNGGGSGVYFKETAVLLLLQNPIVVDKLKQFISRKFPDKDSDTLYSTVAPLFKSYLKGNKLDNEDTLGLALIIDKLKAFMASGQFFNALNNMRTVDFIKDGDGTSSQTSEIDVLNALELNHLTEEGLTKNFMELSRLANDCSSRFLSSEKHKSVANSTKRIKVRVGSAFEILQARYTYNLLIDNKYNKDSALRYIKPNYYTLCDTDSDRAKVNHFISILNKAFDLINNSGNSVEYFNLKQLVNDLISYEVQLGGKSNNNILYSMSNDTTLSTFRVSNDDGVYLPDNSRALLILKLVVVYNRTIKLFEDNGKYKFNKLSSIAGNKKYRLDSFQSMSDYIIASKVDAIIEEQKTYEYSFIDKDTGSSGTSSLKNLSTFGEALYDIMSFKVIPKMDNTSSLNRLTKLSIDLNKVLIYVKLLVDNLVDPDKDDIYSSLWCEGKRDLNYAELDLLKNDYYKLPFIKRYKVAFDLFRKHKPYNCDMIYKLPIKIVRTIFGVDTIMSNSNCKNLFLNLFRSSGYTVSLSNGINFDILDYLNGIDLEEDEHIELGVSSTYEFFEKIIPCILLLYSVVYSVDCAMSDLSKSSDSVSGLDRGYNEVFAYEALRKGTNSINLSDFNLSSIVAREVTDESGALTRVPSISPLDLNKIRFSYRTIVDFIDNDFEVSMKISNVFNIETTRLFNTLARQLSMPIKECIDIIKRAEVNYSEYLSQFNIDLDNGLKSKRIMLNRTFATVEASNLIGDDGNRGILNYEPTENNIRSLDSVRMIYSTAGTALPLIRTWLCYIFKPYFNLINEGKPIEEITTNVSMQSYLRFFKEELSEWERTTIQSFNVEYYEDSSGFLMEVDSERFVTLTTSGELFYLHKNGYLFRGETNMASLDEAKYMIL